MIAALLLAAALQTSSPSDHDTYEVYGIGQGSCGTWLSTPSNTIQGDQWILGWWSATNLANERNKFVGEQTDGEGILGEVRKVCTDNPSMLLINATASVYVKMATVSK